MLEDSLEVLGFPVPEKQGYSPLSQSQEVSDNYI